MKLVPARWVSEAVIGSRARVFEGTSVRVVDASEFPIL
jgi:hypothetical protein